MICRDLGILPFIESPPHGFQTMLTETGNNLSVGQRQRLGIARAFYVQSAVLVCDGPTASLDSVATERFLKAVVRLQNAACTVIIAIHGGSFLPVADRIMTLHNGAIIDSEASCARLHGGR